METPKDPVRFWGGAIGAAALGLAIVVAIVFAQKSKPETAAKPQAVAKTAAAKPQMVAKAQTMAKPQAVAKTAAAVKPLTQADRKLSEELWVEQRKVDADTRAVAATPEGRRRVAETIAKQLKMPDTLVNELRGRKMGYGEITVALALSQQLVKRDKVTPQQALATILGPRKAGQGWGAIARDHGLKLDDVLNDVKRTDKRLAKLEPGK